MCNLSISHIKHLDIHVSDIVFSMNKTYADYDVLRKIKSFYPNYTFYTVIGTDVYESLTENDINDATKNNINIIVFPRFLPIQISSSILKDVYEKTKTIPFVSEIVSQYLLSNKLLDTY